MGIPTDLPRRLILVRHAKSSWTDPGLPDFDRPLNHRGRRDAPAAGRRLAATGWFPDRLLASPARRARETALALAVALGYPEARIEWIARIYEADVRDLLDLVRQSAPEAGTLLVVGHNPGITELATLLSGRLIENVPTAGVVRLSCRAPDWSGLGLGQGRLVDLDYPKRLR